MNKINFNQTGGFPLSTDILESMQTAYNILGNLGSAVGYNCIISGCEIKGLNITDGVIILNGEVMPFQGSGNFLGAKVIVQEDIENKIFEDSKLNPVVFKRYAKLSTSNGVEFSNMARIKTIVDLTKAIVPVGLISMWSGSISNIPKGWLLCNGQNGTPDLRDRFVVGAGQSYQVSDTGGTTEVELTVEQLPSHSHTGIAKTAGKHSHSITTIGYKSGGAVFGSGSSAEWVDKPTVAGGEHTHSLEINQTGGSKSHENRPPYYALAFIMFKG